MAFIDSHCHFDFDAFSEDRAQVWSRCRQAGVQSLVIPGVSIPQWRQLFALVHSEPDWYGAVGVHPWWVKELAIAPADVRRAVVERVEHERQRSGEVSRCVAVGECGLDANIETPLEQQLPVFEAQLDAARALSLPVIVHSVRAHADVLRILKKFSLEEGGVIHAFSGSREIAEEYVRLGFYLGVGGTITYERAAKTRRALSDIPLEKLLLESDAPDMPLAGRQGERNSPEYLPQIAQTLAELRGISPEQVIAQTGKNACTLFGF
ncbi:TatD family hydrolase [Microbulbifer agarilyticus]|uniref:TatD family hydrolase n=1 Tax=Microbulbifer agarilyticus TaxID=260552 RepID=UPI001C94638C|nr:TatD family hydrolase [Microbulbifer agarilyticus]MBY6189069.1 TatD family hydrolase [Microbulbifer agarilyticus]